MRRFKKSGEREKIVVFRVIAKVITVSILMASSAYAEMAVLDFESLATPGTGYSMRGITYSEDGFTIKADLGMLYSWNIDDPNFPGSTALFNVMTSGRPSTLITRDDGQSFDMESIMLSELTVEIGYIPTITLKGTKIDNSTVIAYIELDGIFGFETFSFADFTSLKELRSDYSSTFFQFDQIVFDVVPEPGTLVLLALGVFILPKRK